MFKIKMLFTYMLAISAHLMAFPQEKQPNIIFIISDSHRSEALGAAGNLFVQTPHLDELAGKGTRFENAYVTTAICTGTGQGFFIGHYRSGNKLKDLAKD